MWKILPLLLFVTACTSVPPDVFVFEDQPSRMAEDPITHHIMLEGHPMCIEKINELECGHGRSIMTARDIYVGEEKEHFFNGKPWSQLKSESVYVPAEESFAPLSVYIINSCKQLHCDKEVSKFRVKVDGLSDFKKALDKAPSALELK